VMSTPCHERFALQIVSVTTTRRHRLTLCCLTILINHEIEIELEISIRYHAIVFWFHRNFYDPQIEIEISIRYHAIVFWFHRNFYDPHFVVAKIHESSSLKLDTIRLISGYVPSQLFLIFS
jgi:hypothetical protein